MLKEGIIGLMVLVVLVGCSKDNPPPVLETTPSGPSVGEPVPSQEGSPSAPASDLPTVGGSPETAPTSTPPLATPPSPTASPSGTPAGTQTCSQDSDCVPSQCCHAASCAPVSQQPDCSGIMCSQECRPGSLDCGGRCSCVAGQCRAETVV